jgi:hypothetical protein
LTLQGDLDTLSITEALRLLVVTNKTGCLRVQGDRGQAILWLRDGALTAGTTDRVPDGPFDEVVSDLLRYEAGSFVFDVDDRAPDGEGSPAVEDLLQRARMLLAEWDELRAAVPSLDHQVVLSNDLGDGPVTITARQWPILFAVAAGCSVGELAVRLGLTELGVLRVLDDLGSLGVTRIQSPPQSPARRRARGASSTRLA